MNLIHCITKFFVLTIVSATILLGASSFLYAANGKKNHMKPKQNRLWQPVDENSLPRRAQRSTLPEKYILFRLNNASLQSQLKKLPLENTNAAREETVVMEIPQPDGKIERFRIEETQVLSPELAAQYPTWKSFVGYGIDNPQAIGRFDWNVLGFHGYIESGKGTVVIDPYQKGDTENYVVFYKHEYGKSGNDFSCTVRDKMSSVIDSEYKPNFLPDAPEFAIGATVRQYRIAIATTGEWTRNAGGFPGVTDPATLRTNALAVVSTTVVRLNGIFTRELASTFQLVNPAPNNTDGSATANNIIFDDPANDPYDNTSEGAQLTINHATITSKVGTPNFDIGHLYGTGGGGVAQSPSLCDNADKGQGYSARGTNTGDPFTVDYVAHEIGHQFGSDHTYNNVDASGTCTTRSATDAFEVASGATIMSYVGICENRNLQQFVDTGFPSFHIRSMTTINTNVQSGTPATTGCGTTVGTNSIPNVNAGGAFTIPRLTPFTLTATGTDADANDVDNLLYSWEQYDLAQKSSGLAGDPAGTFDVDTDNAQRPLFRVYSPVSSNSRTYPSPTFILNPANNDSLADVGGVRGNQPVLTYTGAHPTGAPGAVCEPNMTCVVGERLPTIERAMNFRVSLRDRRGGVQDAGTTVSVAAGTGPFQIITQNAAESFIGGTPQTVGWDVANTGAGTTVNAALVRIRYSTDGGLTFPTILVDNTPNDGTESVIIPNAATTTGRIKVEAVGNIFFDINNANLQVTLRTTAASVTVSGRVVLSTGRGVFNALVTITDENGAARTAKTNSFGYYRFADVAAGGTYIFNVSHKRYQSPTRVASVAEDLNEYNFTVANRTR